MKAEGADKEEKETGPRGARFKIYSLALRPSHDRA
jgi:hypothetical protein